PLDGRRPCRGYRQNLSVKLAGEPNRFCLHVEMQPKNEAGGFERIAEDRWLDPAMVEPLPHSSHPRCKHLFRALAEGHLDRKHRYLLTLHISAAPVPPPFAVGGASFIFNGTPN